MTATQWSRLPWFVDPIASKKILSFALMEVYEKLHFFFFPTRKLKLIREEDNGIKAIWSKKTSVISIDVCL